MASPFSRQQNSPRRGQRSGNNVGDNSENLTSSRARARSEGLSVETRRQRNGSPYQAVDSDDDSDNEDFRTRRRHNKRTNVLLKSGRDLLGRLGRSGDEDDDDDDYDSDQDQLRYPTSALNTTRDDESDASDECMILTDDEDDGSETEEEPASTKPPPIFTDLASPRSSTSPNNLAAIQSIFADKHPWRRQSRRDSTKVYSAHGPRIPAVNSMEEDVDEPSSTKTSTSLRERISGLSILQSKSEGDDEEGDSSSSSEDEASSTQSSVSIISDPQEDLDFGTLENIPNYFTSHPEAMLPYCDPSASTLSESDSSVFAYEHSLLLRAVLQLLAERDYIGVEADIDDPTCIIKKGPLKKASHSVARGTTWRVKYVEVRPGSFSYFEDTAKRENFGRKTIPLRSNRCTCEALKRNLIALKVEGGPTRLWMTNSDDECQAWVRAIRDAMIGAGANDSNHSLDVSQYQGALDQFQEIQRNLFRAKTRADYMGFVEELLRTNIRVPSQWVNDRANLGGGIKSTKVSGASAQSRSSVTGFWKSLQQEDTFSINGCLVSTASPHSTERIIGALSRCILELDKSSPIDSGQSTISELQALSFARDVLMTIMRSRSKDEARVALEYLCLNPSLVEIEPVVGPTTKKAVNFQVNYATSEANDNHEKDFSGWVPTRTRMKGMWRNRFLVIADGILNVFEHSTPRPHGLRGQILLSDADVSVISAEDKPKNEAHLHILRIVSRNKEAERQLSFPDEALLDEWKNAVETAVESFSSCNVVDKDEDPELLVTPRASMLPAAGGRFIQGAESGVKIMKRGADQFVKATDLIRASIRSSSKSSYSRTSSSDMMRVFGGGSKHGDNTETSESLGLSTSFETELPPKQEPTVQIAAESTSMYKIVSRGSGASSEGDRHEALATVLVKMLHTFLLSGGPNGRLTRGDTLVEMEFRLGSVSAEAFVPSESMSP